ncbi:MAG: hypothetical protein OEM05_13945 [Myxococcales bacterium]|nr:hypothetical protein [Myxococcales bacterium]
MTESRSRVFPRLGLWLLTIACFVYLYFRIDGAAGRVGQDAFGYLRDVFAGVNWAAWLALMIPYSVLFFLIDTAVVWRIINWFNARVRYRDLLPIRGSAYIISIVNEQVGKGVMAVYLNRRDGVPGWEVGSSMLFIMFCEFYYLLLWAVIGYALGRDSLPDAFVLIPYLAVAAAAFFVVWMLYFRGVLAPRSAVRDRPILKAFREARLRHYAGIVALRSPALLSAVVIYTLALRLFGVEAGFFEMLGYLPVIFFGAAVPTPMRAAAITLWVTLFPERPGEMAAFGIVQHNFFIFFNAAIGLLFLRRANRELFGGRGPG